jgi:hypothetical protein
LLESVLFLCAGIIEMVLSNRFKWWIVSFNVICQMCSVFVPIAMTYFVLFPHFILAYTSGTYKCIMDINEYGEGNLEMSLWLLTLPFCLWGIYLNLKFIKKYLNRFYTE